MVTITITDAPIDITPVSTYTVDISWRYGSSGSYTVAATGAVVNIDGSLVSPVDITFDETINPYIEIEIVYAECLATTPFYISYTYPSGTGPTTTTTTSTTSFPVIVVYWGFKSDNTTLTPTQIEASPYNDIIAHNATVVADYTDNAIPQYLWMAEPNTQTAKTIWYGDDFNNGEIGGALDLFGAPVASGGYRFYITQYLTQNTDTPIEFRIS